MGVDQSKFVPPEDISETDKNNILEGLDGVEAVAALIKKAPPKSVVVLCGAGISVSAGIPDFRSPKTGLYANLQKYNLPKPESIFDIEFFNTNPEPFTLLAHELYPDGSKHKPTPTHHFLRLLYSKGKLRRVFTQNIDCLERMTGLPHSRVMECHGSFASAHCLRCNKEIDNAWLKQRYQYKCTPLCESCGGVCKPDITFFGESLPHRFAELKETDLKDTRLIIVLGTSLKVAPVSQMPLQVHHLCARVLVNMEPVSLCDKVKAPKTTKGISGSSEANSNVVSEANGGSVEANSSGGGSNEANSNYSRGIGAVGTGEGEVTGSADDNVASGEGDGQSKGDNDEVNRSDSDTDSEPDEFDDVRVGGSNGFRFKEHDNYRDVFLEGACDTTIKKLACALGWENELKELCDNFDEAECAAYGKDCEKRERNDDS